MELACVFVQSAVTRDDVIRWVIFFKSVTISNPYCSVTEMDRLRHRLVITVTEAFLADWKVSSFSLIDVDTRLSRPRVFSSFLFAPNPAIEERTNVWFVPALTATARKEKLRSETYLFVRFVPISYQFHYSSSISMAANLLNPSTHHNLFFLRFSLSLSLSLFLACALARSYFYLPDGFLVVK